MERICAPRTQRYRVLIYRYRFPQSTISLSRFISPILLYILYQIFLKLSTSLSLLELQRSQYLVPFTAFSRKVPHSFSKIFQRGKQNTKINVPASLSHISQCAQQFYFITTERSEGSNKIKRLPPDEVLSKKICPSNETIAQLASYPIFKSFSQRYEKEKEKFFARQIELKQKLLELSK